MKNLHFFRDVNASFIFEDGQAAGQTEGPEILLPKPPASKEAPPLAPFDQQLKEFEQARSQAGKEAISVHVQKAMEIFQKMHEIQASNKDADTKMKEIKAQLAEYRKLKEKAEKEGKKYRIWLPDFNWPAETTAISQTPDKQISDLMEQVVKLEATVKALEKAQEKKDELKLQTKESLRNLVTTIKTGGNLEHLDSALKKRLDEIEALPSEDAKTKKYEEILQECFNNLKDTKDDFSKATLWYEQIEQHPAISKAISHVFFSLVYSKFISGKFAVTLDEHDQLVVVDIVKPPVEGATENALEEMTVTDFLNRHRVETWRAAGLEPKSDDNKRLLKNFLDELHKDSERWPPEARGKFNTFLKSPLSALMANPMIWILFFISLIDKDLRKWVVGTGLGLGVLQATGLGPVIGENAEKLAISAKEKLGKMDDVVKEQWEILLGKNDVNKGVFEGWSLKQKAIYMHICDDYTIQELKDARDKHNSGIMKKIYRKNKPWYTPSKIAASFMDFVGVTPQEVSNFLKADDKNLGYIKEAMNDPAMKKKTLHNALKEKYPPDNPLPKPTISGTGEKGQETKTKKEGTAEGEEETEKKIPGDLEPPEREK